jgi:hypothetical protein
MDLFEEPITWRKTLLGGGYVATYQGRQLKLRMNDFPDEQLFTLFVNGAPVTDFDDWPSRWLR